MTVTLELESELARELQAQAQARGVTVEYFLHDLVSEQVRVFLQMTLNLPVRNLRGIWALWTFATSTTMPVSQVLLEAVLDPR